MAAIKKSESGTSQENSENENNNVKEVVVKKERTKYVRYKNATRGKLQVVIPSANINITVPSKAIIPVEEKFESEIKQIKGFQKV